MTTWRCPVCRDDLRLDTDARAWRCDRGHSFDVAREGYVNLLVTHQRRQRQPGDSPEMVRARRRFLDGGWYEPLRAALRPLAELGAVCDVGCGEGWYTRDWPDAWGVDIARAAVAAAAKRAGAGNHYAVASAYDLPLADACVAVVLSVFAPLPADELRRVARPDGVIVTVTPGRDHLAGLASHLFDTAEPHPGTGPFDDVAQLEPAGREELRYDVDLPGDGTPGDLLGMTPWSWYVDADTRARVAALPHLSTPVHFVVSTYRRAS